MPPKKKPKLVTPEREHLETEVYARLKPHARAVCSALQRFLLSGQLANAYWIRFFVRSDKLEDPEDFPLFFQMSLTTTGDEPPRPLIPTPKSPPLAGIFVVGKAVEKPIAHRTVCRCIIKWLHKCWKNVAANDRLNQPGRKCNSATVVVLCDPIVPKVRGFNLRAGEWRPTKDTDSKKTAKPIDEADTLTDPEDEDEEDIKTAKCEKPQKEEVVDVAPKAKTDSVDNLCAVCHSATTSDTVRACPQCKTSVCVSCMQPYPSGEPGSRKTKLICANCCKENESKTESVDSDESK